MCAYPLKFSDLLPETHIFFIWPYQGYSYVEIKQTYPKLPGRISPNFTEMILDPFLKFSKLSIPCLNFGYHQLKSKTIKVFLTKTTRPIWK